MNILGEKHLALDQETRCECGQLMAKIQPDGLHLKCKRCKRIVTIPFASIQEWTIPSTSIKAPAKKTQGAKS
jgi:phage FluMu protein Com